ncbi:tRNA pseudouridine synthase-like 1 [Ctenocephalides felis]|uniref:tRNA pseudouridine synthase-like 1 n=1 Tax=Ctenocephalides felis TaxID=7515 RepID=UPI000E6E1EB2|nr:tRNA pseudouridine synthase-like 1 [Ctenocephalides felis]
MLLAILKQEYSLNNYRPTILQYFVETPIEEQNRCIFIPNPKFDVEAFRKAAKLLEGYHDFRTFMTTLSKGSPPVHTLRYIHEVSIEKSTSTSLPFNNASNYFDYWDIKFKGKSFLYRQVRRMVGVLLAVAQHRITEQDVITMLQVPSPYSWCTSVRSMPPHGLYLCDVEYRDEDLMLPLDYIEKHQNSKEIYDTANLRHINIKLIKVIQIKIVVKNGS